VESYERIELDNLIVQKTQILITFSDKSTVVEKGFRIIRIRIRRIQRQLMDFWFFMKKKMLILEIGNVTHPTY